MPDPWDKVKTVGRHFPLSFFLEAMHVKVTKVTAVIIFSVTSRDTKLSFGEHQKRDGCPFFLM